jgi:hypothetical protein
LKTLDAGKGLIFGVFVLRQIPLTGITLGLVYMRHIVTVTTEPYQTR